MCILSQRPESCITSQLESKGRARGEWGEIEVRKDLTEGTLGSSDPTSQTKEEHPA